MIIHNWTFKHSNDMVSTDWFLNACTSYSLRTWAAYSSSLQVNDFEYFNQTLSTWVNDRPYKLHFTSLHFDNVAKLIFYVRKNHGCRR